jgi:hypothetical protein
MPEVMKPLPLTGTEVQEAILFKIAESMSKSCHLSETNAYTSFRADIKVNIQLGDYGRETPDNHIAVAQSEEPLAGNIVVDAVDLQIAEQPPNQVRIETGQDVPVETVVDGKKVIKRVKYQARRGRPPKQG